MARAAKYSPLTLPLEMCVCVCVRERERERENAMWSVLHSVHLHPSKAMMIAANLQDVRERENTAAKMRVV